MDAIVRVVFEVCSFYRYCNANDVLLRRRQQRPGEIKFSLHILENISMRSDILNPTASVLVVEVRRTAVDGASLKWPKLTMHVSTTYPYSRPQHVRIGDLEYEAFLQRVQRTLDDGHFRGANPVLFQDMVFSDPVDESLLLNWRPSLHLSDLATEAYRLFGLQAVYLRNVRFVHNLCRERRLPEFAENAVLQFLVGDAYFQYPCRN